MAEVGTVLPVQQCHRMHGEEHHRYVGKNLSGEVAAFFTLPRRIPLPGRTQKRPDRGKSELRCVTVRCRHVGFVIPRLTVILENHPCQGADL